eukprot:3228560-Amphidinium_carterae.2
MPAVVLFLNLRGVQGLRRVRGHCELVDASPELSSGSPRNQQLTCAANIPLQCTYSPHKKS